MSDRGDVVDVACRWCDALKSENGMPAPSWASNALWAETDDLVLFATVIFSQSFGAIWKPKFSAAL